MRSGDSRTIMIMAAARLISAGIEIAAAVLFVKLGRVDYALRINSALGVIGQLSFLLVSAAGIAHLAGSLDPKSLIITIIGLLLVILGTAGQSH